MTRPTLFKKILAAMLLLSLLPLLISSGILFFNLGSVREKLAEKIAGAADLQASESLQQRAVQVAAGITEFLEGCEADLKLFAALPRDPMVLTAFYNSRKGEIWHRTVRDGKPGEVTESIHRYSSMAVIDRDGRETFLIREGRIIPKSELRNVSHPVATDFKSEEYFLRTRKLNKGEVYVSHVTGFHISKAEQLNGAADPESAISGGEFRGVIRFATPLFDGQGDFAGIVMLALDHRLLMEFSQHILPGKGSTVFPSYMSGNYSFIFDDEGWIVTHPKYWDIRGVDAAGKLIPPYTAHSSAADVASGRIPFNLDHAGFIHPNYPVVAGLVRQRQSGHVDITNVGGAQKIMAFAPILYDSGDYRRLGIFGGVTIGFQVDQFHEMARTGVALMNTQLHEHLTMSSIIVAGTVLLVLFSAWFLSLGITRPLALLTEGARKMADGEGSIRVEVDGNDELGALAGSFNKMADELEQKKNSLLKILDELSTSRQEILDERNFKESVLESISSAIVTISPEGILTSINGTGRRFLGSGVETGAHYRDVFSGWGDMAERVHLVLAGEKGYGREPLVMENDLRQRYFEVGFFPIGGGTPRGITVTMRDETERERMREEMTRMDRLASLGKLSAGIAHEVRNPLTGVSLLLDDLHDQGGIDPGSRTMLQKALAEIERVEKLIAGLLTFSSPPKTELRHEDLNRIVLDTLLLLRRECERKGVQLNIGLGEVGPFRLDAEKLKQALLNLVKNSLEVLEEGGIIHVATSSDDGTALIRVSDTGPGIAGEDLPLIFEPYFTRKGAGTGLGLSITQRIVAEHSGRITVESEPGRGTTFTVILPMGAGEQ